MRRGMAWVIGLLALAMALPGLAQGPVEAPAESEPAAAPPPEAPEASEPPAVSDALEASQAPVTPEPTPPSESAPPPEPADAAPAVASAEGQAPSTAVEPLADLFPPLDLGPLLTANDWPEWTFLLGAIFVGLLAGRLAAAVLRNVGDRWSRRGWEHRGQTLDALAGPASLALLSAGLGIGLARLHMGEDLRTFSNRVLLLLYSIVFFWGAYNLIGLVELVLRRLTGRTHSALDDQLVPIIRKALRLFLLVIAVLFIAENVFAQDIGAWLAGLGIAGLAVSLAAQDSLKNFFGSVAILFDRPFRVGERIKLGTYDGVVEDIGLRSTRLRTFFGHLVAIPNANVVNEPIENVTVRGYFRRDLNVTLTYDTPVEKVEEALRIIKNLLASPELRGPIHGPDPEAGNYMPPRVYFNNFNADSLNISVIYWYRPVSDWWAYSEHAEKFNLALLQAFNEAGIEFAFPTRTLFLAGDPQRELALRVQLQEPADGRDSRAGEGA